MFFFSWGGGGIHTPTSETAHLHMREPRHAQFAYYFKPVSYDLSKFVST